MRYYWKLYTVSDDGIFPVNCELYILEKRNAAIQFIIDTGAKKTKTDTAIKDWNFDYFEECVSLGYF